VLAALPRHTAAPLGLRTVGRAAYRGPWINKVAQKGGLNCAHGPAKVYIRIVVPEPHPVSAQTAGA
jgi:hypothetical protein